MEISQPNMEFSEVLSLPCNTITPEKLSQLFKTLSERNSTFQIINLSELQNNGDDLIIINNNDQSDAPTIEVAKPDNEENIKTTTAQLAKTETKTVKRKEPPIKCPLCKKVFDKVSRYCFHMKKHQSPKKFQCKFCTQSYNKEVNYKIHMTLHNTGTPMCPICDRKFQRVASLKAHLVVHEVDESFSCIHCKDEFEKEDELYRHLEIHEGEVIDISQNDVPLRCNYCNYVFNDVDKYKRHIQLHIQAKKIVNSGRSRMKRRGRTREYAHKCKDCVKSFPKLCLLERHQRTHTGEKPFLCTICKRGFSQKSALSIHSKRHEGNKPHACMFCPAKFVQKGNLIAHLEKTHSSNEPDEKVYKCTHCTCVFKKISSLNGHVTRLHSDCVQDSGDIMNVMSQLKELERQSGHQPATQKPNIIDAPVQSTETNQSQAQEIINTPQISYVKIADSSINGNLRMYEIKQRTVGEHRWYLCSVCNKEFKKPSDLIRHMRIHTKEKPYKCPKCDLSFAQKSTVNNHLATHSKNEFVCAFCKKNFGSVRSLNVHLKKHEQSAVARKNHSYKCSGCDKTFDTLESANLHMKLHEVPDDGGIILLEKEPQVEMLQPLIETDQGLFSIAPPKPKIPLATLDEYKDRPFKCHICNAAFIRGAHLKKHMACHCIKKEFTCSICLKQFVTHSALKEHLMYHKRSKNHSCPECKKAFMNASMLQRHITSHKLVKPFLCPYCKKRFRAKEHCRKHIARHNINESTTIIENNEISQIENIPETSDQNIPDDNLITFNSLVGDGLNSVINLENVNLPESTERLKTDTTTEHAKYENIPQIHIQEGRQWYYNIDDIHLLENADVNGLESQMKLPNSDSILLNQVSDLQEATKYDLTSAPNFFVSLDGPMSISNETTFNPNLIFNSSYNGVDHPSSLPMTILPDTGTSMINSIVPVTLVTENAEIKNDTVTKDINYFNISLRDFLDVRPMNSQEELADDTPEYVCSKDNIEQQTIEVSNVDVVEKENAIDTPVEYSCPKCFKQFNDEHRVIRHISAKHKSFVDHTCKFCPKKFKKKSDMDRHLRTHTGEKPFTCTKCEKAFAIKSTLMSHLRTHNPNDIKPFPCLVCNSRFGSAKSLKTHMQTHVDKAPFRCDKCTKTFKRRHHMVTHMQSHENKTKKLTKMDAVTFLQTFVYETNDKIHEEQQQAVEAAPEEVIPTANLFTDEIPGFGDNIDPVTIRVTYNQPISFTIEDSNNIIPNEKGEYFVAEPELNQVSAKDKKFQCDVCLKYYVTNSVLRKHKRTLHGEHKCDKCNKAFSTIPLLLKHDSVHGGDRPFNCTQCTNSFSSEANLKVHCKRMHTGLDMESIVTF